MQKNNSIHNVILASLLIITLISITLMGFLLMWSQYSQLDDDIQQLQIDYTTSQKQNIQHEVEDAIRYIQYKKSEVTDSIDKKIQAQVEQALAIAWNIYNRNQKNVSDATIKTMILDALRPIRFFEQRSYFFIFDIQGNMLLNPLDPLLEGKNVINWRDVKGGWVIRDMLQLVEKQNEGFTFYYRNKVGDTTSEYPKYAFVKRFEPYQWVIGTGEYLDDIERDVQQEIFTVLSERRFGKDNQRYLFAFTSNGIMLMHAQARLVGSSMWDMTDSQGNKFMQSAANIVNQKPEGDFIQYDWLKQSGERSSPRLSFIKKIPNTNIIMGAGFHIDEIDKIIDQKKQLLLTRMERDVFKTVIILFFLILLVAVLAKNITNRIKDSFDSFLHSFQKAIDHSLAIETEQLYFLEFKKLAIATNQMLDNLTHVQRELVESERKLLLHLQQTPLAYIEWDILHKPFEKALRWNPAAEKIFGYSEEEALNASICELIVPKEYHPHIATIWQAMLAGKYQSQNINENVTKSGKIITCEWHNTLLKDENDQVIGLVSSGQDITKRQQAEIALRESEEIFRAIGSAAQDAIIMMDDQGNISYWNNAAERIFGYSKEEAVGQHLHRLIIPQQYQSSYAQGFINFVKTGCGGAIGKTLEVSTIHKSGLEFPVEISLSSAKLREHWAAIGIARDITERKQTEAQLKRQNETLVKLNQDKNEFLAIAAHDLKNPLSAILGLAEEIQESFDELSKAELLEFSGIIQDSAERMFQLITNLLDVNIIESGKVNISLKSIDILPILCKLVTDYHKKAQAKQIILQAQELFETQETFIAVVDENTVHQILDNLISNAVKYSPQNKQIYIRIDKKAHSIRCEIQDEGPGLSKLDQQKLFGKFTRLTTKPTAGEHSTGLGLFIVKKLVDAMNGQVWCESELEQGATFIVEFPIS